MHMILNQKLPVLGVVVVVEHIQLGCHQHLGMAMLLGLRRS